MATPIESNLDSIRPSNPQSDNRAFHLLLVHTDLILQAILTALFRQKCIVDTVLTVSEGVCFARIMRPHLVLIDERQTRCGNNGLLHFSKESPSAATVVLLESDWNAENAGRESFERLPLVASPARFDHIINNVVRVAALHGKELLGRRWDKRLGYFLQYVYANHARSLTHTAIAEVSLVSAQHLGVMFRQATGLTLSAYIVSVRVELVKRLLTCSNDGIEKLAERVGFSDASHLSRMFHRQVGCGPGAYRRLSASAPITVSATDF